MNRGAQVLERCDVAPARTTEDPASAARLTETLQEAIRRQPVMFITELADKLGTSTRTILRQLRAGTFFIPELPRIDKRHRWSRERVYQVTATSTFESHRQSLLGPRAVRKGVPGTR